MNMYHLGSDSEISNNSRFAYMDKNDKKGNDIYLNQDALNLDSDDEDIKIQGEGKDGIVVG